jgi:hypothetical protein
VLVDEFSSFRSRFGKILIGRIESNMWQVQ